jgi:hypothetical protein
MLCAAILRHQGVLVADRTIKYKAQESVLKLQPGDRIPAHGAAVHKPPQGILHREQAPICLTPTGDLGAAPIKSVPWHHAS